MGLEVEMHQDNNGGGLQWFRGDKEIHIFNASTRTVYTQTSFIEISIEAGILRSGKRAIHASVGLSNAVVLVWHLGIISTHAVIAIAHYSTRQLTIRSVRSRVCLAFRSRV